MRDILLIASTASGWLLAIFQIAWRRHDAELSKLRIEKLRLEIRAIGAEESTRLKESLDEATKKAELASKGWHVVVSTAGLCLAVVVAGVVGTSSGREEREARGPLLASDSDSLEAKSVRNTGGSDAQSVSIHPDIDATEIARDTAVTENPFLAVLAGQYNLQVVESVEDELLEGSPTMLAERVHARGGRLTKEELTRLFASESYPAVFLDVTSTLRTGRSSLPLLDKDQQPSEVAIDGQRLKDVVQELERAVEAAKSLEEGVRQQINEPG